VDCVVVNRDGGEALFEAIHSLRNQTEIDLGVVVVDNASKPEERERLAREAPEVRVVTFSRNLGFAAAFEVPGVSATAALFRRDALTEVARHGHFFDDRFFAYYEDVDLSLRLARAGWRFACDPQAVAWHEGSRTGRRTPFRRAVWTARNRWRTLLGNFDRDFLKRNLPRLLRADLAHAKSLGAKGTLLPVLVWPLLPAFAFRARGKKKLLPGWPSTDPEDARPTAAAAGS
jgi:GT2 family glycosyltransferase